MTSKMSARTGRRGMKRAEKSWAKDGIEDGVQNQRFDWRPSRYIDCLEYSMAEDGLVKNFADELELLKGVFPGDAGFLSSAGG